MRWEWLAALLIGCGIYWGTRAGAAPFSTLIAWSESIRESWESPRERAPIPHAELLTEYCSGEGIDLQAAMKRLEAKGIKAEPGLTLRDIAVNNGYSKPYDLLETIRAANK